jgi:AAA ATPase domain
LDPIANPYTPNAGSRPPELAGRAAEIEQFRVVVGRLKRGATEQSMIVRGLRGVGKTVLLNTFEDHAEAEGFLTYYHELTPDSSLVAEIARDAQAALARFKLSARATRAVRERPPPACLGGCPSRNVRRSTAGIRAPCRAANAAVHARRIHELWCANASPRAGP